NANILLLARRVRKPPAAIEALWRKAKQAQAVEGDKSNYLAAWWKTLQLLGVSQKDLRRKEPLQINDVVEYGKLAGAIRAYDAELAYLTTTQGQRLGFPIILLYLTE